MLRIQPIIPMGVCFLHAARPMGFFFSLLWLLTGGERTNEIHQTYYGGVAKM